MARPHFLGPLQRQPGISYRLFNETRGQLVAARLEPALESAKRRRGLLGRDSLSPDTAFVIAPTNSIHTFGMRFPIDLLFVKRDGKVLKRVIALPRRRISASLRAFAVIEFCANQPGVAATRVGDVLVLEKS
jgi:uncharacterized membrane protein (UPF0127 family)